MHNTAPVNLPIVSWVLTEDPAFVRTMRRLAGDEVYSFLHIPPSSLRRQLAIASKPCILVIDRDAPTLNITSLLLEMAAQCPGIASLVLATDGDSNDGAECLRAGADGWLSLPVTGCLLAATLSSLYRRTSPRNAKETCLVGDLMLDRIQRRVWCADTELRLTCTEFLLLLSLAQGANRTMSREALTAEVWIVKGTSSPTPNALEVYIGYLRRKLRSSRTTTIATVRGEGYSLRVRIHRSDEPQLTGVTVAGRANAGQLR